MPHYCRICTRYRSNEKFSGRGHRDHICKDCQRLPREERDRIDRLNELDNFLNQSHISPKNIARLEVLTQHGSGEVRELAKLLLEVARLTPYKRRRWKILAQKDPILLSKVKPLCSEYGYDCEIVPDDIPDPQEFVDSDLPF
jgi:hypothetical protein